MKTKIKFISFVLSLAIITMVVSNKTTVEAAMRLNKTSLKLKVGNSFTLRVKGTTKKVKWSSKNKKVVTITKRGKVTAKKPGKSSISAKVSGSIFKCIVTVRTNNDKTKNNTAPKTTTPMPTTPMPTTESPIITLTPTPTPTITPTVTNYDKTYDNVVSYLKSNGKFEGDKYYTISNEYNYSADITLQIGISYSITDDNLVFCIFETSSSSSVTTSVVFILKRKDNAIISSMNNITVSSSSYYGNGHIDKTTYSHVLNESSFFYLYKDSTGKVVTANGFTSKFNTLTDIYLGIGLPEFDKMLSSFGINNGMKNLGFTGFFK